MKINLSYKSKIIVFLLVSLAIPFGWLYAGSVSDKVMFFSVLELIKREYVKEVDDKTLVESAISGMLVDLDPHSSFLNEKDFEEMKTVTKGEFGGIGVEIMIDQGGLKVITPIDDTPAFKAKVKPGDLIFAIDEELIVNMTPADAINKMRGPKGTKVKISILREGELDPIELTLTRDIIKNVPVKSRVYNDIAYIRISSFSDKTADSLIKTIKDLKASKPNQINGYVLDLRNNPGGLLDQAIKVTDQFIDEGVIVSTKGRNEKDHMVFKAEVGTLIEHLPMVVLVNNGSASAAEIVAGALQDNKRAVVVGTKSFGKGSVQNVIPVPGYGAIRLTTALYYTPSGKSIQAEGIVPDIIVEPARIESLAVKDKKLRFSESTLRNHLANKTKDSGSSSKDALTDVINKTVKTEDVFSKLYEEDYQLARAIDVLKSMQVLKNWQ